VPVAVDSVDEDGEMDDDDDEGEYCFFFLLALAKLLTLD